MRHSTKVADFLEKHPSIAQYAENNFIISRIAKQLDAPSITIHKKRILAN
jgi:hypothetical protein